MYRQLLKCFLVIVFSLSYITCFGQFTNDNKFWYNLRGKPKTCVTVGYNRITRGDSAGMLRITSFDSVVFNRQGHVIKRFNASTANYGKIDEVYPHTYKYDSKGNISEMMNYDYDGKAYTKFEFTYSAAQGLYLLKRYDLAGIDTPRVLYGFKVDSSGRILAKYNYNENIVPDVSYQYSLEAFKYDAKGLRVAVINMSLDGGVQSKRLMKYNRYNNMVESADSISNIPRRNTIMTFDYPKYDKFGNWLNRNRAINGRPHSVDIRRITYHK